MKAIKRQTNIKKVLQNKEAVSKVTYVITPSDEFIMIGQVRANDNRFKVMLPVILLTENIYL